MQLRDYQLAAVQSCWDFIGSREGNPCIVLPTGAGKSLVLAKLAHDAATTWNGRVIILAHVKELLQQNADKLKALSPDLDIGIYSAGLNRRDRRCKVLVAGIQSVYNKAFDFDPFDLIIVDEAHMLPPDGEGMYRQFLGDCKVNCPHVRLIGLTATPYRMQTGWLCGPHNLLNEVCHEVGVKELIDAGWLSKLISKEAIACDTSKLHIRGGEFVADEAAKLMGAVIKPACDEILKRTELRRSVLIFCQSIEHAVSVKALLSEVCLCRVEMVDGDTPALERAAILKDFKAGAVKYLVNVNVLTTGFDAPNVDCVCLLRPTLSPGLYYQMVGRGFRTSPGKENCLVLDFGGNVKRHGPVDQIQPKPIKVGDGSGEAPTKTCPQCESICHAAYSQCPHCAFEFPETPVKHDRVPDAKPILSTEVIREEHKVLDVTYNVHHNRRDPNKPPSMRVDYKINPIKWVSEWVCIEHEGFARIKAEKWWRARSPDPVPDTAEQAVTLAEAGALAQTLMITTELKSDSKYETVMFAKIGPKPEPTGRHDGDDFEFPADETATTPTNGLDWSDLPW